MQLLQFERPPEIQFYKVGAYYVIDITSAPSNRATIRYGRDKSAMASEAILAAACIGAHIALGAPPLKDRRQYRAQYVRDAVADMPWLHDVNPSRVAITRLSDDSTFVMLHEPESWRDEDDYCVDLHSDYFRHICGSAAI
jgi:hypothetical protein